MAENYVLQVTAGTEYDITKHQIVPVNQSTPITIDSEHLSASLNVRVQSYRGLPNGSPSTSPYFSLPPHDKNKDQYSIAFSFTPKSNINADDLVFGNDFDHPIKDRLPPGFSYALKFVKGWVDPGLDGDVYADQPYLYSPAASSFNALHIGGTDEKVDQSLGHNGEGLVFEEGGDEEYRKEQGIPSDAAHRKKYFLTEEHRKNWDWEAGRSYGVDFFNAYLDFNEFALNLPAFKLRIMSYWDGQGLRYVLKNRKTDTVLLVVLFTLYLKDDVVDGVVKEGVEGGKPLDLMSADDRAKHEKAKGDAAVGEGKENEKEPENDTSAGKAVEETNADDVD